jgi:hypothetical protein
MKISRYSCDHRGPTLQPTSGRTPYVSSCMMDRG